MSSIEMKAGKMKLVGTTLQPDLRKGMLRLSTSREDSLLHLTWTSRETGVMEDDRIIFPGDAEYKYVEQARGNAKNARVFVLKFQGSSERLFFWMQEPSADKDEENMRRINARISGADTGDADTEMGVPSDIGALDQRQLLSLLTRRAQTEIAGGGANEAEVDMSDGAQPTATATAASGAPAAAVPPPATADTAGMPPEIPQNVSQNLGNEQGAGGGGVLSQANLEQILANLGSGGGGRGAGAAGNMQAMASAQAARREGPSLSDVLDGRAAQAVLAEVGDLQEELLEHLPADDQSVEALGHVLRSPQLAQAVGQLDQVLQSGQGRELLLSFGLEPAQGFDMYGPAAVKHLLDQIQKKAVP